MKAHWEQFFPHKDRIDELTGGVGIGRAVWIYRRSLLSQAISLIIARQTGVWIAGAPRTGDEQYEATQIAEAARWLKGENAAWQTYLSEHSQMRAIAIAYEDLLDPGAEANKRLVNFLGLELPLVSARQTSRQSTGVNEEWKRRFINDATDDDQWIFDRHDWSLDRAE